jgi:hypothetical protein
VVGADIADMEAVDAVIAGLATRLDNGPSSASNSA